MNLSAPTQVVFIIALIIAIIALLMMVNVITFIPVASFWVMTIAYVVLAIGCMIKGACRTRPVEACGSAPPTMVT